MGVVRSSLLLTNLWDIYLHNMCVVCKLSVIARFGRSPLDAYYFHLCIGTQVNVNKYHDFYNNNKKDAQDWTMSSALVIVFQQANILLRRLSLLWNIWGALWVRSGQCDALACQTSVRWTEAKTFGNFSIHKNAKRRHFEIFFIHRNNFKTPYKIRCTDQSSFFFIYY